MGFNSSEQSQSSSGVNQSQQFGSDIWGPQSGYLQDQYGKAQGNTGYDAAGWGGFNQIDEPVGDQWMYHAVADCILATSLLSSFPEVDAKRIGITGISWGGIITCIVAAVDERLKFAAPVYGCGHLGEVPGWLKSHGPPPAVGLRPAGGSDGDAARRWLDLWDPSRYLSRVRMPMLWVAGTNDFAFPLPQLQASYRQPQGERTLAVRVNMVHGQGQGAAPEEIAAFADSIVRPSRASGSSDGSPPLARLTGQGTDGKTAWARFAAARPVVKAEFNFTRDGGLWKDRKWQTAAAELKAAEGPGDAKAMPGREVRATVPDGATAWYFNLIDERGLITSTEHQEPRQ